MTTPSHSCTSSLSSQASSCSWQTSSHKSQPPSSLPRPASPSSTSFSKFFGSGSSTAPSTSTSSWSRSLQCQYYYPAPGSGRARLSKGPRQGGRAGAEQATELVKHNTVAPFSYNCLSMLLPVPPPPHPTTHAPVVIDSLCSPQHGISQPDYAAALPPKGSPHHSAASLSCSHHRPRCHDHYKERSHARKPLSCADASVSVCACLCLFLCVRVCVCAFVCACLSVFLAFSQELLPSPPPPPSLTCKHSAILCALCM